MDVLAVDWRSRLRVRLKQDKISYRELAREMNIGYTTLQNHLSNEDVRKESLWFVRRICQITDYSLLWVLFGVDQSNCPEPTVPWLTRIGVGQWISHRKLDEKQVNSWFNCPQMLTSHHRIFVWQVLSDEIKDCGWQAGSWLYVDPDVQPIQRESRGRSPYCTTGSPLCLVRLKDNDGLMVCRLETVANKIWVLPGNRMYPVHDLTQVDIVGQVIAGFRQQNNII